MHSVLGSFERWPQFYEIVSLLETTTDPHAQAMNDQSRNRADAVFMAAVDGLSDDKQSVVDVNNAVLSVVMRQ